MIVRIVIAACIALASLAVAPYASMACTCVRFTNPDYARQATLVFAGTVTRLDVHSGPLVFSSMDPVDVVFDVETVYKGEVARTFQVSTVAGDASCGYSFVVGRRYTVFPWQTNDRFSVTSCNGTVEGPISPVSYLLPAGYAAGADPLLTLRSAIVIGTLIAGGVLILATRLRAGRPA